MKIMKTEKFISHSELETRELGREFAKSLMPGQVILLYGDLGSGKTVFVRGVCEAFNISCVRSPSFTLINEYEADSGLFIIHADLYRLESSGVYALGLEEYADSKDSVMFIEWPERWQNIPDYANLTRIYFTAIDESTREIKLEATLQRPHPGPLLTKARELQVPPDKGGFRGVNENLEGHKGENA